VQDRQPPERSPYPPPFPARLLAPRFWGTWLGLGGLWLLAKLPWRVRAMLGDWAGDVILRRNAKRRDIVLTNLEWCFPERSDTERLALARRYFRNMVRGLLDYGVLWWGGRRRLRRTFALAGTEHIAPLLEAGTPLILLTCHHAGMDFAGVRYNLDYPALSIFKHGRNELIDWFLARGRTRWGGLVYEREDNMRPIVRLLRRGYALYYLPDEDLGPERSVFAPFFGVPTATLPALGRLAKLGRATVVPFMTYYDRARGTYTARLFPALEGFPTGDDAEDAARMNAALEQMIRLAPEQYMWSLRLFQTRPDGGPWPYGRTERPWVEAALRE